VTVLGVNDETLGVMEIRVCFDAIENTIPGTKKVKVLQYF
jgi:hypothetical protein